MYRNLIKSLLPITVFIVSLETPINAATMKGWFEAGGTSTYYPKSKPGLVSYIIFTIKKKKVGDGYELDKSKNSSLKMIQKSADSKLGQKYNGWTSLDINITDVTFGKDWDIEKLVFSAPKFDDPNNYDPKGKFGSGKHLERNDDLGLSGMIDLKVMSGEIKTIYKRKSDDAIKIDSFKINKIDNKNFHTNQLPPMVMPSKPGSGSPFFASVPESSSPLALIGLGALGLFLVRNKV